LIVTTCSSTGDVDGGAQLLVRLAPGRTSPVQVELAVPGLEGTVTLLVGGVEAGADAAASRASAPTRMGTARNNLRVRISPLLGKPLVS
jgi:hypothetical protein